MKKSTLKKVICIVFFILSGVVLKVQAQTETIYFDVVHKGKIIGTLKTEKSIKDSKTIYTSYTNLEFHLITTIKIEYSYNVIYDKDILESATVKILVNGRLKTNVKTTLNSGRYTYYSDGKVANEFVEEIKYSIEKLSFEEPEGVEKVYAEEHGEFHKFKKIATHLYLKTAPNGHKNTYFYKDGKLQNCDVDAGVVTFSIVRKN